MGKGFSAEVWAFAGELQNAKAYTAKSCGDLLGDLPDKQHSSQVFEVFGTFGGKREKKAEKESMI